MIILASTCPNRAAAEQLVLPHRRPPLFRARMIQLKMLPVNPGSSGANQSRERSGRSALDSARFVTMETIAADRGMAGTIDLMGYQIEQAVARFEHCKDDVFSRVLPHSPWQTSGGHVEYVPDVSDTWIGAHGALPASVVTT